jgi:hypothetical protein
MTVAHVSAGNQDAVYPFQKSPEQEAVMDPATAHEPDQTYIGRILHTGYTGQVSPGVGTPVADECQYVRFFSLQYSIHQASLRFAHP